MDDVGFVVILDLAEYFVLPGHVCATWHVVSELRLYHWERGFHVRPPVAALDQLLRNCGRIRDSISCEVLAFLARS